MSLSRILNDEPREPVPQASAPSHAHTTRTTPTPTLAPAVPLPSPALASARSPVQNASSSSSSSNAELGVNVSHANSSVSPKPGHVQQQTYERTPPYVSSRPPPPPPGEYLSNGETSGRQRSRVSGVNGSAEYGEDGHSLHHQQHQHAHHLSGREQQDIRGYASNGNGNSTIDRERGRDWDRSWDRGRESSRVGGPASGRTQRSRSPGMHTHPHSHSRSGSPPSGYRTNNTASSSNVNYGPSPRITPASAHPAESTGRWKTHGGEHLGEVTSGPTSGRSQNERERMDNENGVPGSHAHGHAVTRSPLPPAASIPVQRTTSRSGRERERGRENGEEFTINMSNSYHHSPRPAYRSEYDGHDRERGVSRSSRHAPERGVYYADEGYDSRTSAHGHGHNHGSSHGQGHTFMPVLNPTNMEGRSGTNGEAEDEYPTSQVKRKKLEHSIVATESANAPPKRRQTRRSKQTITPPVDQGVPHRELTAEELRLASSDLEDTEDIWIQELSAYYGETRKRQRQVEMWFEDSCVARNNEIARANANRYATRIGQIPPPVPRPVYVPVAPQPFEVDGVRRSQSPGYHDPNGIDLDFENTHAPGHSQYTQAVFSVDAENAAQELEESILGVGTSGAHHGGQYDGRKRDAASALSDESGDLETKRMRIEMEDDITDEVERSIVGDDSQSISTAARGPRGGKGKTRGTGTGTGTTPVPSVAGSEVGGPTKGRRKPLQRKKGDVVSQLAQEIDGSSVAASIAGDRTPTPSVPPSPALSATLIYEIGEVIPPLKRARKVDEQVMLKRIQGLEEAQKKVWLNIARRDVAKVYKHHLTGYGIRVNQTKKISGLCAAQAKKTGVRSVKAMKEAQTRAKRLMREMMVFWKKNEKEERDLKKRAEKEADNRAKEEEEKREAARQARKLEFLISQTELYSHFVGNKLKTAEIEGEAANMDIPEGAEELDADAESALADINFDDEDETNLHAHARKNAKEAIELAKSRAVQFDTQAALERKTNEALALAKAQAHVRDDDEFVEGSEKGGKGIVDLDSDELNFQNPTSLTGPLTIGQPKMLQAQLKEYQLKGLNWLGTLYEQGINGILADEMGLGKTVQSISLLAYLAETHDIWGPFLVVAPASTLHNWQQELTRFVPRLKALPYWGNVKDRTTLRKFWSKKEISYNQDAPFHVLITSYQLVTQDQQYFQRVKWQYMVLDEAQNIKNSSSARWKTLLGFHCRNRLLLTGTPIQNNMQELWALLHFIMPSLFDSHDEFNEWFSKDIENAAAENKGSKLNEHQLRRLHMILKPFMLRRVKRHVQNELSEKIEIDIYVSLSARQRSMYKALRDNISVADLIEKAAHIGDAEAARTLMNLVMQFRKVCNHPELFERADVVAPLSFSEYGRPGSIAREGDFVACHYSTRSPIEYSIPEMFYLDGGLVNVPREDRWTSDFGPLRTLLNIWSSDWIQRSLETDVKSPFNFVHLLGLSSGEAHALHSSSVLQRLVFNSTMEKKRLEDPFIKDSFFDAFAANDDYFRITEPYSLRHFDVADNLPPLQEISTVRWAETCLSRPVMRWYVPPVIAPPSSMYTTNRNFVEQQANLLEAPEESLVLYGLPPMSREDRDISEEFERKFPGIPVNGLLGNSPVDQLPLSYMQVPEAKRLIYDSAKLARLDALLHELKAGDHRVLIYFQMTRMMDLMEEYLIYRQYKYLRLDGSSKLEDRRDMVIDWQTKPDIFVFLLSTRAGGLGINLTAADTVVFYDHDWNPSNDAQAMDRAHRLGQTRQVTVYRLITKGTIDERIVQLARVKKDVQDIVVGNKQFTDVTKPNEIVSLLLNDDELANLEKQGVDESGVKKSSNKPTDGTSQAVRELFADEGDDFFGHSGPGSGNGNSGGGSLMEFDEDGTPVPTSTSGRGKKRGRGGAGASGSRGGRGGASRRGGKKKASGTNAGGENPEA